MRISRHAYHKMKEGGLLVARSVSAFEFVGNRTAYILLVSLAGTLECTETLEAPRHRSDRVPPPTLRPVARERPPRITPFSRGTTSITPPHKRSRRDTLLAIVSTTNKYDSGS